MLSQNEAIFICNPLSQIAYDVSVRKAVATLRANGDGGNGQMGHGEQHRLYLIIKVKHKGSYQHLFYFILFFWKLHQRKPLYKKSCYTITY